MLEFNQLYLVVVVMCLLWRWTTIYLEDWMEDVFMSSTGVEHNIQLNCGELSRLVKVMGKNNKHSESFFLINVDFKAK